MLGPANKRIGKLKLNKIQKSLHDEKIKREKMVEYRIKRQYKLTVKQYEKMLDDQDGACAVCGNTTALCIDHDHELNMVRGLLCRNCNFGLGFFKDNTELLLSAIQYITNFETRNSERIARKREKTAKTAP